MRRRQFVKLTGARAPLTGFQGYINSEALGFVTAHPK